MRSRGTTYSLKVIRPSRRPCRNTSHRTPHAVSATPKCTLCLCRAFGTSGLILRPQFLATGGCNQSTPHAYWCTRVPRPLYLLPHSPVCRPSPTCVLYSCTATAQYRHPLLLYRHLSFVAYTVYTVQAASHTHLLVRYPHHRDLHDPCSRTHLAPRLVPYPHAPGDLAVTYLDEDLRVSRGNKNNLFVLTMDDRTARL